MCAEKLDSRNIDSSPHPPEGDPQEGASNVVHVNFGQSRDSIPKQPEDGRGKPELTTDNSESGKFAEDIVFIDADVAHRPDPETKRRRQESMGRHPTSIPGPVSLPTSNDTPSNKKDDRGGHLSVIQ